MIVNDKSVRIWNEAVMGHFPAFVCYSVNLLSRSGFEHHTSRIMSVALRLRASFLGELCLEAILVIRIQHLFSCYVTPAFLG